MAVSAIGLFICSYSVGWGCTACQFQKPQLLIRKKLLRSFVLRSFLRVLTVFTSFYGTYLSMRLLIIKNVQESNNCHANRKKMNCHDTVFWNKVGAM